MQESTNRTESIWRWDDEREGMFPFCPVCDGATCNTPSGNVICLEYGSEHFRQPMADVFAHVPSAEEADQ